MAGLFVLVKTSNPGGRMFQDLVADGKPVYRHVAEFVESLAVRTEGDNGYGAVGAVVGATFRSNWPSCGRSCRTRGSWCPASAAKGERRATWLRPSTSGQGGHRQQLPRHHLRPLQQGLSRSLRGSKMARSRGSRHPGHDRPASGGNAGGKTGRRVNYPGRPCKKTGRPAGTARRAFARSACLLCHLLSPSSSVGEQGDSTHPQQSECRWFGHGRDRKTG